MSGADRLFEGDPAPTDCFAELVNIYTENAIGTPGVERLVPWLGKPGSDDYLVILCDPRLKSTELRQSVKTIWSELASTAPHIFKNLMIVNADSPAENRRWIKKNQLSENDETSDTAVSSSWRGVYSDEKMEWMRAYTALGDKRWSMTVFVIANGRVEKLAREVDIYGVSRTIQKAVQAYQSEKDKRL